MRIDGLAFNEMSRDVYRWSFRAAVHVDTSLTEIFWYGSMALMFHNDISLRVNLKH
jgi:hypothetical protein